MNHSLAIVIPAFKKYFFKQTLESIAAQTNKNFTLYIGDDASPENLAEITEPFKKDLNITYHRFDENLGSTSLVQQWNRCVRLANQETWIWFFSDDDIMEPGCVDAFYNAVDKTGGIYPLYRFNTTVIDSNNNIIASYCSHPETETPIDFAINRFNMQSPSTACEYIFKREIFEEHNGFVDFPIAWGSDDATWILFSSKNKIFTVSGSKVNWRLSCENISGIKKVHRDKKVTSLKKLISWFNNYMLDNDKQGYTIEKIYRIQFRWYCRQFRLIEPGLQFTDFIDALKYFRSNFGTSYSSLIYIYLRDKLYGY